MRFALTTLVFCTLVFAALSVHAEALGKFVALESRVGSESRQASLYVPADYDAKRAYPLIVFLHGSGERGDDGVSQTEVGIGKAIRDNPERFPCLVLMPQCASDDSWVNRPGRDGSTAHAHITAAIEQVIKECSVDEDRISLTGLSMGGGGTNSYGAANVDRFAAFMPVCGRGTKRFAREMSERPMWAFHGDADNVIPIHTSQMMVETVNEAGGDARLTTYPGVGHNSWDRAYSKEQGAVEWLLEQKR
ncbi:MAG: dienelactone hydrolase family protein [Candidatus Hydrogenedentota bacterium]